jgi:hypothetical protein
MKKKPVKVKGLQEALKHIPEEDRAGLAEEIKKMFSNVEEVIKNSKPVEQLPTGTTKCPHCNTKLTLYKNHTFTVPGDNKIMRVADCLKCDCTYMVEALSSKMHIDGIRWK